MPGPTSEPSYRTCSHCFTLSCQKSKFLFFLAFFSRYCVIRLSVNCGVSNLLLQCIIFSKYSKNILLEKKICQNIIRKSINFLIRARAEGIDTLLLKVQYFFSPLLASLSNWWLRCRGYFKDISKTVLPSLHSLMQE